MAFSHWHVFITLNRKILNFAVDINYEEINKVVKNFALSGVIVFLLKVKPS